MSRIIKLQWCLAVMLTASCLSGCGSSTPEEALAAVNDSNMKRLANLYTKYQSEHFWQGPENEEQFRDFIDNRVPEFIKERIGMTTTDELFISERDGQPFKIRYGVAGSARGCSEPAIFEESGSGSYRKVGFLNMLQKDVDEAEYDQLWQGIYEAPETGPPPG